MCYPSFGEHRRLYTFRDKDYQHIAQIWKEFIRQMGGELEAFAGLPGYSGPVPELLDLPEEFAPGVSVKDLILIAEGLKRSAGL